MPLSGQECQGLPAENGYVVTAAATAVPAAEYLTAFVEVAAYRWRVPSNRRNAYAGWQRVRQRLLPPEPRWADDWRPKAHHQAVFPVVVYRDRDPRAGDLMEASGDGQFDGSLESIVDEPMPGSPELPRLPSNFEDDSLTVLLTFGLELSGLRAARIRFAAEQTAVRLVPGTLRVEVPRGSTRRPSATVKYDVTQDGFVDPASIEVLRSSDGEFARSVEAGVQRARFTPATSNCRPIAQSVVQTFGND